MPYWRSSQRPSPAQSSPEAFPSLGPHRRAAGPQTPRGPCPRKTSPSQQAPLLIKPLPAQGEAVGGADPGEPNTPPPLQEVSPRGQQQAQKGRSPSQARAEALLGLQRGERARALAAQRAEAALGGCLPTASSPRCPETPGTPATPRQPSRPSSPSAGSGCPALG